MLIECKKCYNPDLIYQIDLCPDLVSNRQTESELSGNY